MFNFTHIIIISISLSIIIKSHDEKRSHFNHVLIDKPTRYVYGQIKLKTRESRQVYLETTPAVTRRTWKLQANNFHGGKSLLCLLITVELELIEHTYHKLVWSLGGLEEDRIWQIIRATLGERLCVEQTIRKKCVVGKSLFAGLVTAILKYLSDSFPK